MSMSPEDQPSEPEITVTVKILVIGAGSYGIDVSVEKIPEIDGQEAAVLIAETLRAVAETVLEDPPE